MNWSDDGLLILIVTHNQFVRLVLHTQNKNNNWLYNSNHRGTYIISDDKLTAFHAIPEFFKNPFSILVAIVMSLISSTCDRIARILIALT